MVMLLQLLGSSLLCTVTVMVWSKVLTYAPAYPGRATSADSPSCSSQCQTCLVWQWQQGLVTVQTFLGSHIFPHPDLLYIPLMQIVTTSLSYTLQFPVQLQALSLNSPINTSLGFLRTVPVVLHVFTRNRAYRCWISYLDRT